MLNLSLTAVARGEVPIRGEILPDDPMWEGSGINLQRPLRVDLVARSVGQGVLVRGTFQTELDRECRRCLTPVSVTAEDSVDMLFEPLDDLEAAEELGGEVYELPARGDDLDLRPALREQILLRVPHYVVCSDDCRGLCPHCGTDLNQSACACAPVTEASSWDALKQIKFD